MSLAELMLIICFIAFLICIALMLKDCNNNLSDEDDDFYLNKYDDCDNED